MKVGAVGALALAALLTLAVSSASGKAFAAQVSCGQVITQDTRVDNDLIDCPGDGLVIGADDVTLDLNRHTIDGTGVGIGVLNGVFGGAEGHERVTVENGTVREFDVGVFFAGANDGAIRAVAASSNKDGIYLSGSNGNQIERYKVTGNSRGDGGGIRLLGSLANVVERNVASSNFNAGIVVQEQGFGTVGNTISDNLTTDNAHGIGVGNAVHTNIEGNASLRDETGISLGGFGTVVSRNRLSEDGEGIRLSGAAFALIRRNAISDSQRSGIALVPGLFESNESVQIVHNSSSH